MNPDRVDVRITLGDMPAEDAFQVVVPSAMASKTIGGLLESLFPVDQAESRQVLDMLDTRANPDLPEMYTALTEMMSRWRAGTSRIDLRTPDGDHLLFSDQASSRLASPPSDGSDSLAALHLVLEHRFLPLEAYAREGGDRREVLGWMRGCVLLYFLDKHGYRPPVGPDGRAEPHIQTVVGDLSAQGLIAPSTPDETFEITPAGRTYIGQLMRETESYIRRFDKFSDVIPGNGLRPTEFGTGRGMDLRVQLFVAEGIDAYRAVFLLRMYDGTLDTFGDSWQRRVGDEGFFDMLLEPVLDYSSVAEEDLERVNDAGRENDRALAQPPGTTPLSGR